MTTRNTVLLSLLMIAAATLYSVSVYAALPPLVPCHWNIRGEVDGWMEKRMAVVFGPGIMGAMLLLMQGLPRLSPKPFSTETFGPTLNALTVQMVALMGFIHGVMLAAALHPEMESGRILVGGIMLFMGLLGNLMGRVRRNLWVGVRTPWTLASDRVWIATHRMAARLFTLAGFLSAALVWAGVPVEKVFAPFMIALLTPIPYSWWIHRQGGDEAENGENTPESGGNGGGAAALLIAAALAGSLASPARAESREVTFAGAGGLTLRGTLLLPTRTGGEKLPAVLLMPGSGPPDRDGNVRPYLLSDILKRAAERLAAEGIASLRFDKRSAATYAKEWPKGAAELNRFCKWENFAGDVRAAYRFLGQQPEVDPKRLGVAGHSEGGLLTLQLAHDLAGTDDSPKAIALLATAGRTIDIVLREQIAALLAVQTTDKKVIDEYLDFTDRAIAQVKKDATLPPNTPPGLAPLFNPTTLLLLQSYFTNEPVTLAEKYTGPVLIVQGDKDTQVSVERDAPRLLKTFQARKTGSVQMVTVSGVGHQFQVGNPEPLATDRKEAPATAPQLLDALGTFFKKAL